MTKTEYIAHFAAMPRKEILRVCRAGGLAAHNLQTNEELALLLWNVFGSRKFGG